MKKCFWVISVLILMAAFIVSPALAQKKGPDPDAVNELLATGEQAVSVGDVLMDESFSNDDNWKESEEDAGSSELVKGKYQLTVTDSFWWELNQDSYTDVVIQVETDQISEEVSNVYGVVCRADLRTGTGYYLQISGSGYYNIGKLADPEGEYETLVDWTEARAINGGQDTNEITAVCVQDYLALYVNAALVVELQDSDLTEGQVGMIVGAYDKRPTEITFDNLIVWEATAETGSSGNNASFTLADYAGEPEDAVAELRDLGLVPKGGKLLFLEDRAFFSGQGNWFTPLARRSPSTNIVMGGQLAFSVGNPDEFELCSLSSRITTNNQGSAISYVDIGLANSGELLLVDLFSQNSDPNLYVSENAYDINQPLHILITLIGDRANVFVDGELALADVAIEERSGSYGIALRGKGPGAKCEGENIWVYTLD
ncbi:MAG TPA: hypothetical protein VHO69_01650 [Phototrophicaceae bacterium]|nr:hypothetical protein [Phototrophicaceae bacterium]